MSERDPGKEHEPPSFSPVWGPPIRPSQPDFHVSVLVRATGNAFDEEALTGEGLDIWADNAPPFLGFRLCADRRV
jgi:hypothetical protein